MVLVSIAVVNGVYKYYKKEAGDGSIWEEIMGDVFQTLVEEGAPIVEGLAGALGTLGAQTLEVIEGAGIAIMKATETAVDYATAKVAPHRVDAVAITTAMIIYGATAFTIINRIRSR